MIRCTICDFEIEAAVSLDCCPKCGTKSLPYDTDNDVTVKINWHELRILATWAEFWANQHESTSVPDTSMRQTIYSIVRRLEVQHPQIKQPLTLGGELRDLERTMAIETNIPHAELFDPTSQGGKVTE